jgi:hypothetical protein
VVDVEGDLLEPMAHRIVGDGGQMHDGIHVTEDVRWRPADVPEVLHVDAALRQDHRAREPGREVPHVEPDQ